MDENLFNDLMASCNEVLAYRRDEIQLKTTTLETPDDELEPSQLLFQKSKDCQSATNKKQSNM